MRTRTDARRTPRRWEHALAGALTRAHHRVAGGHPERGDVPGWVLVTLMTAGLVTALWLVAGPALSHVFSTAISSVTGPGAP